MYSYLEVDNHPFDDFYLEFCGMQECKPSYSYGPAVRSGHVLHYCLKGKGKFYLGDQVYEINKGDAFLIRPNQLSFYQADATDPWTYLWIGFSGSKSEQYLEMCNLKAPNCVVNCDYLDE